VSGEKGFLIDPEAMSPLAGRPDLRIIAGALDFRDELRREAQRLRWP